MYAQAEWRRVLRERYAEVEREKLDAALNSALIAP
jgi:hypothetical protein